ncbi:hypothetical protein [Methylobacterium sp. Leaf117]|uniref:DUF6894 family protein n=1 Tax=Methylobacterium sp. Leaf117 TaxID=1736260 RepID=UPI000AAFE6F1|nr:hypothetical protein [Methylobacterium sp. Leaf117]
MTNELRSITLSSSAENRTLWKAKLLKIYFDFDDSHTPLRDEEGIDLPDVEAARTEVLRALADIAKDVLPKSDQQAFRVSARNASGDIVYSAEVTISGGRHEPRHQ